jgi:hypothetical protein
MEAYRPKIFNYEVLAVKVSVCYEKRYDVEW